MAQKFKISKATQVQVLFLFSSI